MRFALAIFGVCTWVCAVSATDYFVRTDGNDSNTGTANTSGAAWLTIGKAEATMAAGDTVRVADGTYNERVTVTGTSGTAVNWINFIGNTSGTGVVMRGFTITDVQYIRLLGFEMTHTATTYRAGVYLTGSSTSNIMILDNYIHDVNREGIVGFDASYVTVRGNHIYWVAHPGSLQDPDTGIASNPGVHHWLVEYNHLHRCSDFIDVYGQNHIFRNNWMHDVNVDTYWNIIGTHPDFFQPGSDGQQTYTRHHIIERNIMADNESEHGHGVLQQDNPGNYGDEDMLIRGNVFNNIGGGVFGGFGTDYVQSYNNTVHHNLLISPPAAAGSGIIWYRTIAQGAGSIGGMVVNTLISDIASGNDAIFIESPDNQVTNSYNWGYSAGTESSFLGTADPLMVAPASGNFRLQSSSPVIDIGTHITRIASASASGTTFSVENIYRLNDGFGTAEGDRISTGGTTTRIMAISGTNITVSDSVTWTNGQLVYWETDITPDLGAFPYGSTKLTAATISTNGTTYTVTPTGDARGVWFYVDGIPTTWDYDAPYAATIASGTVTAKAYALYAQSAPVVLAGAGAGAVTPAGVGILRATLLIIGQ